MSELEAASLEATWDPRTFAELNAMTEETLGRGIPALTWEEAAHLVIGVAAGLKGGTVSEEGMVGNDSRVVVDSRDDGTSAFRA